MYTFKSDLSGREYPVSQRVRGSSILPPVLDLIKKVKSSFDDDSAIATSEIQEFRDKYLENVVLNATGQSELTGLGKEVFEHLRQNQIIADEEDQLFVKDLTFGQRMADAVARFGGSWRFLGLFFGFILGWILVNIYLLIGNPIDPFPFILLNLILSCLAAVQAPIIMMSQNRQEEKDRQRARGDFKIDLKAEIEIQLLHEKVDHLTKLVRSLINHSSASEAEAE
ncbi:MAG: DUF1003 domain-containing protein [Ignavibacteria bacterium]|nr:DUF1003 domain-containing protein [Ignavibacteria bacterium]